MSANCDRLYLAFKLLIDAAEKNAVNGVSLATCPRTATEATQAARQGDSITPTPTGQLLEAAR